MDRFSVKGLIILLWGIKCRAQSLACLSALCNVKVLSVIILAAEVKSMGKLISSSPWHSALKLTLCILPMFGLLFENTTN